MIKVERSIIEEFAQDNGFVAKENYVVVQPMHEAPKGVRRLLDGLTGGNKRDVLGGENMLLFISPKELILVSLTPDGQPDRIEEGLDRSRVKELEYNAQDGFGHLLFKVANKQRVYKVPYLLPLAEWQRLNVKALKEVNFFL